MIVSYLVQKLWSSFWKASCFCCDFEVKATKFQFSYKQKLISSIEEISNILAQSNRQRTQPCKNNKTYIVNNYMHKHIHQLSYVLPNCPKSILPRWSQKPYLDELLLITGTGTWNKNGGDFVCFCCSSCVVDFGALVLFQEKFRR